ncbi:helicase [Anaerobacillus arseniciselenatis]|uniref:Helicase n=1 Tax=Anaerobacillus arseniciselenatis TaxID=85682 RepID=A0A1S2LT90_9BACI|nr:DEAD/DEAH box helicase family protein [Anaerobacillus arseniciselenatis]OIJ14887.1 helicase [Anaerobacillus arseniciselenatis]
MIEIEFPVLETIHFKEPKNKNIIKQIIAPSKKIQVKVLSKKDGAIVVSNNKTKFYITSFSRDIPEQYDYVLLSSVNPVNEIFFIKTVKWLKHPKLNGYSCEAVLQSWESAFNYKLEDSKNNIFGLRKPQLGGLHKIMGHLQLPLDIGTVVMPTGTGKTETMLSTLVANKCEKLLITVPSDSLREQIGEKFLSLGLLKKFGLVDKKALYPRVGILKQKFNSSKEVLDFFNQSNVIVTTMKLVAESIEEHQNIISKITTNIFIDEAHHVKAAMWDNFRKYFSNSKVLQFTATPFRNDGQRLDGEIIFNFPLKMAQEQGYFKKIEFLPIREYDASKVDSLIAETAVKRLKEDTFKGYPHILMARCSTKQKAIRVFDLYKKYVEFNPVLIYSNIAGKKNIYESIVNKNHKIIVCVDMLGEGFDLPELKIAAFHDIRKSLPITLQFTGRFTRTKFDEDLGSASFIANIADLTVKGELENLYATDADWNSILSDVSNNKIDEEFEYKDLLKGFSKLNHSEIPFQNIRPKLSTVVYKSNRKVWNPDNFSNGMPQYNKYKYKFFDINKSENMAVFVYAKEHYPDWVYNKNIYNLSWDIIVVYWDSDSSLLYINSSDNGSLYKALAESLVGKDSILINKLEVFKAFHEVKRIKLQNVGLRLFLGRDIRYRMSVGRDVGEAMSLAEKQSGQKAYIVGSGYEGGSKVNIGCSYKGRIWTRKEGDLLQFKNWCSNLSKKLTNDDIDPNQILKETLVPEMISERPNSYPVWIDWDLDMYDSSETRFKFMINNNEYDLSKCEINLHNPTEDGDLLFALESMYDRIIFKIHLFERIVDEIAYSDYKITQISKGSVKVKYGNKEDDVIDFFEEFLPTIWFADGSALRGNEYVVLKQTIGFYPKEEIETIEWKNVDLSKESQGVFPKIKESIQYFYINELKKLDFDIIYDDDYSGEIADIITIKVESKEICVRFYHLKYALGGVVSNQIKNFYEVCGQAQKSIHWKHKSGEEFISHLLRREQKSMKGVKCSRLERGTKDDLEKIFNLAKKKLPMKFEVYIVQPGLSKSNVSGDILTLLGVTESYLKETSATNLRVVGSH